MSKLNKILLFSNVAIGLIIIAAISFIAVANAWTSPFAAPPAGGGTLISSSGNIGIGVSPATKLDVAGDIKTTGKIIGAGSATTYGAITIQGEKGSWSGIQFKNSGGTNAGTLMIRNDGYQGFYNSADSNWDWLFYNGTLNAGTVPWGRISGGPAAGSTIYSCPYIYYDSGCYGWINTCIGQASFNSTCRYCAGGVWADYPCSAVGRIVSW
ncbi:MAG: hypothetical protein WC461_03065 [Candidatus Paceibacterota bacterium]